MKDLTKFGSKGKQQSKLSESEKILKEKFASAEFRKLHQTGPSGN